MQVTNGSCEEQDLLLLLLLLQQSTNCDADFASSCKSCKWRGYPHIAAINVRVVHFCKVGVGKLYYLLNEHSEAKLLQIVDFQLSSLQYFHKYRS